jgi:hypothetical protein
MHWQSLGSELALAAVLVGVLSVALTLIAVLVPTLLLL